MSGKREGKSFDFDVVVIGSGPGGFEAAIKAARCGLKVCVVEKGAIGGVCLNWGCIPTKALLRSAEIFRLAGDAGPFGLECKDSIVDVAQAVKRSRRVVLTMSKGVEYAMKQSDITVKRGEGSFVDAHTLAITRNGEIEETVTAENIIIAAGGSARELPGLEFDGKTIISSREALAMQTAPEKMLIVGGGAIGVEMAWYFGAAGSKVTLVELMPEILPLEDIEVGDGLRRSLAKAGIEIITEAAVKRSEVTQGGVRAVVSLPDGSERVVEAESMLVAVGVVPNTRDLALEKVGVATEKGFIETDELCRTNVGNIFAIGDVRGGMLLAHKASAEAGVAVKAITGKRSEPVDESRVPRCVYVEPSVACVGYTEKKAIEAGFRVKVGHAFFAASGKASAYGVRDGFVKLVFNADNGELLGGHVLGHGAVELIGELSLARSLGVTAEQLVEVIHAHPTLSESIKEAAENALEQ
ncbi:dihydrolipoyl dehydrogenase [Prosthecochloris sp. SCSIO W1101]|uniref:dihydrolipoyl dehydrogenase n=1 Tax=Prosthecochloris sp. SCSIO W1101 TaxID=2992242 RepID=UPI00223E3F7F|nr:dihydrolipoyl dehydrogenase [Prosthecochloris sp. SCSIO W1101]UZJ40377.1 dihydrolipoyl dehydrogenase [Prosthecochloris sp. SCSIO W1101]